MIKKKETRSVEVKVRVRPSEKAAYVKLAEEGDQSISDWLRRLANAEVARR